MNYSVDLKGFHQIICSELMKLNEVDDVKHIWSVCDVIGEVTWRLLIFIIICTTANTPAWALHSSGYRLNSRWREKQIPGKREQTSPLRPDWFQSLLRDLWEKRLFMLQLKTVEALLGSTAKVGEVIVLGMISQLKEVFLYFSWSCWFSSAVRTGCSWLVKCLQSDGGRQRNSYWLRFLAYIDFS